MCTSVCVRVCVCEFVCVSVKVCVSVSVCKTSRSPCIKNTPLGCILSGNGMPISYLIATRGVSYSNIGSIDSTTTTTTATSSRIARSHKSKAAQRAALKLPLRACSRNQSDLDGKVNNALALAVAVLFRSPSLSLTLRHASATRTAHSRLHLRPAAGAVRAADGGASPDLLQPEQQDTHGAAAHLVAREAALPGGQNA